MTLDELFKEAFAAGEVAIKAQGRFLTMLKRRPSDVDVDTWRAERTAAREALATANGIALAAQRAYHDAYSASVAADVAAYLARNS